MVNVNDVNSRVVVINAFPSHAENVVLSRVKKELSEPYLVKQEAYRFEICHATMMQNPLYKEPRDILEAAERALASA